jgi:hypothetical protein
LFSDARNKDGAPVRASYKPRFDAAVTTLVDLIDRGVRDPVELELAAHFAFPPLDFPHRVQLADELIALASPQMREVFDE